MYHIVPQKSCDNSLAPGPPQPREQPAGEEPCPPGFGPASAGSLAPRQPLDDPEPRASRRSPARSRPPAAGGPLAGQGTLALRPARARGRQHAHRQSTFGQEACAPRALGEGQMGSAPMGPLQMLCFLTEGLFGTPINLVFPAKCQGVPFSPIRQKS